MRRIRIGGALCAAARQAAATGEASKPATKDLRLRAMKQEYKPGFPFCHPAEPALAIPFQPDWAEMSVEGRAFQAVLQWSLRPSAAAHQVVEFRKESGDCGLK